MAWPNAYSLDSRHFDQQTAKRPPRPTIVLVHDAFHSPQHFSQLASYLNSTGWRIQAPRLPSTGSSSNGDALEADARTIFEEVREEMNTGRDVILVLHGYAGIPGSMAASRLNEHALRRPRTGFVNQLVFLAGAVAQTSDSFRNIHNPQWLIPNGAQFGVRRPYEVFFADCTPEVAQQAIAILRPQSASSFRTKSTGRPGWMHIPCLYVVCERDNAIPAQTQQMWAQKIRAANPRLTVRSLQSGHSPFITLPRQTAEILLGSIGGTADASSSAA